MCTRETKGAIQDPPTTREGLSDLNSLAGQKWTNSSDSALPTLTFWAKVRRLLNPDRSLEALAGPRHALPWPDVSQVSIGGILAMFPSVFSPSAFL